MKSPSNDPSIENEPHMRPGGFRGDPSESRVAREQRDPRRAAPPDDVQVDLTVWDEPGRSPELSGAIPADQMTYPRWLERKRGETGAPQSWSITLLFALLAGPWAILGAFVNEAGTAPMAFAVIVLAPVIEELMKVSAALYLIERKPYLFRSPLQILVCALTAAFVFAVLENLLYLFVYLRDPSPALIRWRWTVCIALHVGCTAIAAGGLIRVWRDLWRRMARPRLTLASPYLTTAIVVHGIYNLIAIVLGAIGPAVRSLGRG